MTLVDRTIEACKVYQGLLQNFSIWRKNRSKKSSVNDIDTPCTADGYNPDLNISSHHRDKKM